MSSTFGNAIKFSLFGESHGAAIGMVLDNLPPGEPVNTADIAREMQRRRPGSADWTTPRSETDQVEILSGVYQGRTTGAPLALLIRNRDTRSADYDLLRSRPRPGHADLTAQIRYDGANDPRGSGHFSGRLTAPLVAAGAICKTILSRRGVEIAARALEIAGIRDQAVDNLCPDMTALQKVAAKPFPTLSTSAGERMQTAILEAKAIADSVGGIVEVFATGFPAGIGSPFFGGIEPQLSLWFFSIPAVKGVEFGAGFQVAKARGSQNNDSPQFREENGETVIRLSSNNAGGADGGISNGMPIIARLAFKPPASIGSPQATIDLTQMKNTVLEVPGRHDPCIVPRAVPVVEAACALGLLDLLLASGIFCELPSTTPVPSQQKDALEQNREHADTSSYSSASDASSSLSDSSNSSHLSAAGASNVSFAPNTSSPSPTPNVSSHSSAAGASNALSAPNTSSPSPTPNASSHSSAAGASNVSSAPNTSSPSPTPNTSSHSSAPDVSSPSSISHGQEGER